MNALIRLTAAALCVLELAGDAQAGDPDTEASRRQAAERLFDYPAYRQLATRQVYEAIRLLPEEQHRWAREALGNPRVVAALRDVIVRAVAATYTTAELHTLGRFLATPEARSIVEKTDAFHSALLAETFAAALTNADIAELLAPR